MIQQVSAPTSDLDSAAAGMVPASSHVSSRHVRLPALPFAVPTARRMLRQMLRERQLAEICDTALLLVSELVTNAVQAIESEAGRDRLSQPVIRLTLRLTGTALTAEVCDTSPGIPVLHKALPTAQRGRGLALVDSLASSWGHHVAGGGKAVWCTIAIPQPGACAAA